jgi:8-oxo-dGTP pyrophosphatase MutT (NUDIX family)
MDVAVSAPEGYRLPHVVFVRGHAVVVIPLLVNKDTGEEKFLMVRQRRIGNGSLSLEFPAGMLDKEDDTPSKVAVKELFEETGLEIPEKHLVQLSERPLYSSVGAVDEAIFYYGTRVDLFNEDFRSFNLRKRENSGEHEYIETALLTKWQAEKEITSLQVLLGFFLFEQRFS